MMGRVRQTGCGFRVIGSRALLGSLVAVLAIGCADVKKDYPQFGKKWDWWKYPAKKSGERPAEADTHSAATPRKHEQPSAPRSDSPTAQPASAPAATVATPVRAARTVPLEQHRREVWAEAKALRDLDRLPPAEAQALLERCEASLPAWYKPMPVTRPDPARPGWTTLVIWDFMPPEEFDRAAEGWRRIAQKEAVPYPDIPTRRDLPKLIREIRQKQRDNLARPTVKPATTPSAEGG